MQGPAGRGERVWVLGGDSDSWADRKQGRLQAQGSPSLTTQPSPYPWRHRHTGPTAGPGSGSASVRRPLSWGSDQVLGLSALSLRCGPRRRGSLGGLLGGRVRSGAQRAVRGLAPSSLTRPLSPGRLLMSLSGCFLPPPGQKGPWTRALTPDTVLRVATLIPPPPALDGRPSARNTLLFPFTFPPESLQPQLKRHLSVKEL